jgi:hypothetical protein
MIRLLEQVDYNHTTKSLLHANVEGFRVKLSQAAYQKTKNLNYC